MEKFDCLDPNMQLSGRLFVEASAGTGKTFAIEHVVARLILQKIPIDQILITTFTNAGVRDLKQRIYQNLRNLLEGTITPPYLDAFPKTERILSLKNALRLIDEAQIYTIHSFCHRMLSEFSYEANIDVRLIDPEKGFRKETLEIASLDVLRTLIDSDDFSPAMLSRFLSPFQKETKKFVRKMISFLSGAPVIPEYANYKTLHEKFETLVYDASKELLAIAPSYNKTTNRQGEIHPFVTEQIKTLSEKNFEKLILSSPSIFTLFTEENRKKSASTKTHPLIESLAPILHEASDPFILFCRVAKKVQKRLEKQKEGPNILLETMLGALSLKAFKQKVNRKFRALIIDEFQDTDPLQWHIFSALSPELLLVVGDPKQSIYAFRGADLGTFLKAKKDFSSLYELSSNYRSDPRLIDALNRLFQVPNLFSDDFSYTPLTAKKESTGKLKEEPLEFISCEDEEKIFSFIAHEIVRLGESFSFAILVKDRYEAFRLNDYLQNLGLFVSTTATANITEGPSFKFLYLISKVILSPKNMSLAKEILAHPFFGFPIESLKDISEEEALLPFINLSELARNQGLPLFLSHLVKRIYIETREDYADLMQIIGLILEANPESLHKYLEKISILDADDHPYLKRKPMVETSNIQIMTSHMSKGLEFDIVFALGTAAKTGPTPLKNPIDQDLEKIRLLYVAATRAKEKLYLFVKPENSEHKAPVDLVLEKLDKNQFPFRVLTDTPPLTPALIPAPTSSAIAPISLPSFIPPRKYTSFSSLITSHATTPVPKQEGLPPGPETGNLVHLLLEKIIEIGSYYHWNEDQMKALIEKELFKTHLEGFELEIYDHLHAAFFTPLLYSARSQIEVFSTPASPGFNLGASNLSIQQDSASQTASPDQTAEPLHPKNPQFVTARSINFSLKDVRPEYMLQEHAFSYTLAERSYMKGFIDLLFLHNDQYHILDWKMNLLTAYTPETLHTAMHEHSYYTQAQIYREAISRSLKEYPLGPTFYFFLRGKQNGLLKIEPESV